MAPGMSRGVRNQPRIAPTWASTTSRSWLTACRTSTRSASSGVR